MVGLPVFEVQPDGILDVAQSLILGVSLAVTALERRTGDVEALRMALDDNRQRVVPHGDVVPLGAMGESMKVLWSMGIVSLRLRSRERCDGAHTHSSQRTQSRGARLKSAERDRKRETSCANQTTLPVSPPSPNLASFLLAIGAVFFTASKREKCRTPNFGRCSETTRVTKLHARQGHDINGWRGFRRGGARWGDHVCNCGGRFRPGR